MWSKTKKISRLCPFGFPFLLSRGGAEASGEHLGEATLLAMPQQTLGAGHYFRFGMLMEPRAGAATGLKMGVAGCQAPMSSYDVMLSDDDIILRWYETYGDVVWCHMM